MSKLFALIILLFTGLYGCNNTPADCTLVNQLPDIYPDYKNIAVPYNIAPLNFKMSENGDVDKILVELTSQTGTVKASGTYKISFPIKQFKNFLDENRNDTIWVKVYVYARGKWYSYVPFYWKVVPDAIDPFLTYRLIEPGYEVWNQISLIQRNITSFDESKIAENKLLEGSCMNCHIGSKQNPDKSFFHIRGPKGMTVIADGKKIRKLSTKPEGAYSNMIYGSWHPSGRFIAFSTNVVIPSIHSIHDKRAFVYDTISDVVIIDIIKNEIITSNLLSQKDKLETFPEFSADGNKLYFCTADKVKLPEAYHKLQYSLCAIDFIPQSGMLGSTVDTLFNGPSHHKTVSEPKASPNGKYILFTCFSYGTFPLWHNDARLYNYHIASHHIDTLPELNNNHNYSNSYHSWDTNNKWVVFASKRDNGLYGKPYFSFVDSLGKAYKPFVLPQRDADFYDFTYKSFNVPELFEKERAFSAIAIERLFKDPTPVKQVHYK